MHLSPDEILYFQLGWMKVNATLLFTWLIMLLITLSSKLIVRRFSIDMQPSKWQQGLEIVVLQLQKQIEDVGVSDSRTYLPFLGSLFIFIAVANVLSLLPYYEAPTGSLSTTAALAVCVFFAVPYYGIKKQGFSAYLFTYTQPTWLMLPFNIIGELSRTLALAVRLFGNIMSGAMIIAVLLTVAPVIFPVVMTLLGLLTGLVQAYIFFILATVYVAAAMQTSTRDTPKPEPTETGDNHG